MLAAFKRQIQRTLGGGSPINTAWLTYSSVGAFLFGVFSIPSSGYAIALIPMFILASILIYSGSLLCGWQGKHISGPRIVSIGLILMIVSSWGRGVALWKLDQDGVGSHSLASIVWSWISVGTAMLLASIWVRGLRCSHDR